MKRTRRLALAGYGGRDRGQVRRRRLLLGSGSGSGSTSGSGSGGSGSSNAALTASAPGITPTQITIGSHQPLTGPAAPGYSEIAPASAAYFAYVNAHGGVNGRKIVYKYLDDGYNPTRTASVVRQLVLAGQRVRHVRRPRHAHAPGRGELPQRAEGAGRVRRVGVRVLERSVEGARRRSAGSSTTCGKGKILGQYVKQHFAGKKVGFFSQNDEFGQDGVKGLLDELPASMVVSKQTYDPTNTNIGRRSAALRASGAQVVVSFSIPAFTALLKLNSLKLGFNPTMVVSDVGSDPITLSGLLEAFAKQGGSKVNGSQLINGIISDGYLPSLGSTSNSWITLFKKIHDQYDAKAPFDGNVLYGEAVGYTFVQAMFKAGRNPTRADLVSAIQGGLPQGPAVAPYSYSSSDHMGITGAYLGVIQNGQLVQQGPVLTTDASASGAITTYSGSEQQAPASGIPSP